MAQDTVGCDICGSHRCPHVIAELARLKADLIEWVAWATRVIAACRGIDNSHWAYPDMDGLKLAVETGPADTLSREVERVKTLEAVVEATTLIPAHVWAYPEMDALRAALDKLRGE